MFLGIGEILGFLYGAYMKLALGYRYCCDNVALIWFVYAFIYLIYTVVKRNKS